MAAAAAANGGGGGGHVRSNSDPVILSGEIERQPSRGPEGLIYRSISMDSFEFCYRDTELRTAVMESARELMTHIVQRRREGGTPYCDTLYNRPHHNDDVNDGDIDAGAVPDAAPAV